MPVPSFCSMKCLLFAKAANGRSVSATGPSDFSAPWEKSPKELVSTIGPRRISLCGATFFARGGKGNERDPIFLWTCQRKTVSPAKKRVAFEAVLK